MSDEIEVKKHFAKMLLKSPGDPFAVALQLFPEDTKKALKVAVQWPADPIVLDFKEELTQDGEELDFLPTKADLARCIWDTMQRERITADDFAKLGKLYAEVRGFIEKPQTNVQINNNMDHKVIVVKDLGTNDDWEKKAASQQQKLLNVSTSKH